MAALTPDKVRQLQRNLISLGQDIGPSRDDGVFGPATLAGLVRHVGSGNPGAIAVLLSRAMYADFRRYDLVTPLRISHFIAQAAHETGGFRRFVELGSGDGPDADPWDDYLQRYDFRADLGNGKGGDGERYRGRGIFQLTGKANYQTYGKRIGIDLLNRPERAAEPDTAVLIACLFWSDRKLNIQADNDNELAITRAINGGTNGRDDRRARLVRAKRAWGI